MHKGLKRALSALLIALALYSLLGFLILPGIALRIANQQLAQYATLPATLARLQLNPFSLELSLWGLRIGEPGQEQLAFEQLHGNLQLDSLWSGALHLAEVELDRPRVEVLFDQQGTLNLSQLLALPKAPADAVEPARSEPLAVRIDRIALNGGQLEFRDLRPSEPVEFRYEALDLELHHLSTLPGVSAEMSLVASGPQGGRIDWQGQLSLAPISSSGSLKISDARLQSFWPYVRDALPLVLDQGLLSLSTDYQLDLADGTQLQLHNAQATLAPFAIETPEGRPLARLASLEIAETSLNLAKQQVLIGKVRSQQLEAWAAREADGQLDWLKLLSKPDGEQAPAPATAPRQPWQVILSDVQLRDYQVHLADRMPRQEVALDLGPLNLDLQQFDSLGTSPFTLRLDTGLGKQGQFKAVGQVQLNPTTASLQVTSRDIDLRLAQAYLSPFMHIELRSGRLASDLAVELAGTAPLRLGVSGNAQLNQVHSLDTIKERDFVRWQQLNLDGIDYQHGERLSIDRVRLDKPYARLIVNEDLSTNINDLLIPQSPPESPEPATPPTPAGQPLAIHIGEVTLNDGSANFADFSLTPNFATAIQQLNGRIGTLDNRSATPASVAIAGKVDRYAPVSIKGSLNPFDPLASLDIATQFRQVELTTLTPYSGKFAGYRIRKGRLNLDLHYRISNGQLNADNKVVVEQLQLGEKVDSPSAVDLPIRLAVALLKDSEGKISIELPVKGDLNNPEFSVMPIVWKSLRNLVLRAVQAPFKFIAGLVGGGADMDLSQVPFAAGSAELDASAQSTLDALAKALQARPALRLEVEGTSAQPLDGPPLAERRLQRELQNTYYKILQRRGEPVPSEASELQVPEDEVAALFEGIYRARLKQQPPAEWAELEGEQRLAQLREAVLRSWQQSKMLQRQLAQARAAAIKDYLVDRGGLAGERVYLLDVSLGQRAEGDRVASPLHLDSQ
ncbi:DUF748 domain-containing protein [Pseudomonas zhanjiangensis]|uniref:DUF748 domain-containing protein n=1 Tax=Pseudomonas zhanjiangensis TaxID=3239015 RepID=A0ABV3YY33_9PSED